ncbi:hypothetical protein DPMN_152899 [Dreissena polymorpha]|uniref:Uncharacterized protein n=1 Tax=Dreissena polymorpha TaxID=45954 RepID=A0A9D4J8D5_DREPO|nr:hypothetical protein DPMN_152899 [Dreissena polymorpha]
MATKNDRETCLCKLHENPKFKINRLYSEKVINTNNVDSLLESVTCDTNNEQCMYRTCNACKDKKIPINDVFTGKIVEWFLWTSKKVARERLNEKGEVVETQHTMTVKDLESGTIETLVTELQTDLHRTTM